MLIFGFILFIGAIIMFFIVEYKTKNDKTSTLKSICYFIGAALAVGFNLLLDCGPRKIKTNTLPTVDVQYTIVNDVCVDTTYTYHFN